MQTTVKSDDLFIQQTFMLNTYVAVEGYRNLCLSLSIKIMVFYRQNK